MLALVFFNYSVIVRTVGGLWARLDPATAEAAQTLGASGLRTMLTVTLPALAPAIASGAALVFLFCASAFGVVMVMGGVGYGTIETEIWYQTTQLLDLPAAAALSILQLVIVSASLLVANITRARQERALRLSGNPVDKPLRASDWPAVVVTATVALGLLLLPLGSLVWRSFVTADGLGLGNYQALAGNAGQLTVSVWQALANSLAIAAAATALALVLGLLASYVLSRRPASAPGRRALRTLDTIFMLPLGVSAVTVGFGFLITLNRPPLDLRSSWVLIPIAQAMVALPLVVRTLLPTLRAIDDLHQYRALPFLRALFDDNVALDEPLDRRRAEAQRLIDQHGLLTVMELRPWAATGGNVLVQGSGPAFTIGVELSPFPGGPVQFYEIDEPTA